MITMRSLCCGLWSPGGHGDHYEVIVLWLVVTGGHGDYYEGIVLWPVVTGSC